MKKIDKDELAFGTFAFLVGGAIGACIITPFIIIGESKKIRNAINLNTYGVCYPEELRRDIEKGLNKSKIDAEE